MIITNWSAWAVFRVKDEPLAGWRRVHDDARGLFVLVCFAVVILTGVPQSNAQTKLPVNPATSSKFALTSFDQTATDLKPGYLGHDATAVYAALAAKETQLQKSDYEPEDAYEERMQKFSGFPLFRGMTARDTYAFVIHPMVSYDAEKAELKVLLTNLDSLYGGVEESESCSWVDYNKAGASYIGSNAYGVKTLIRRIETIRYNVVTDRPIWLDASYLRGSGVPKEAGFLLPEDGPTAQKLSHTLRVLLIGSLDAPFLSHEIDRDNPTISDPIDRTWTLRNLHMALSAVWLFDTSTGQVIKNYNDADFLLEQQHQQQHQLRLLEQLQRGFRPNGAAAAGGPP